MDWRQNVLGDIAHITGNTIISEDGSIIVNRATFPINIFLKIIIPRIRSSNY